MKSALEKYLVKEGKPALPAKGKKKDKGEEIVKGEQKVETKQEPRDCAEEVYEKRKRAYMD